MPSEEKKREEERADKTVKLLEQIRNSIGKSGLPQAVGKKGGMAVGRAGAFAETLADETIQSVKDLVTGSLAPLNPINLVKGVISGIPGSGALSSAMRAAKDYNPKDHHDTAKESKTILKDVEVNLSDGFGDVSKVLEQIGETLRSMRKDQLHARLDAKEMSVEARRGLRAAGGVYGAAGGVGGPGMPGGPGAPGRGPAGAGPGFFARMMAWGAANKGAAALAGGGVGIGALAALWQLPKVLTGTGIWGPGRMLSIPGRLGSFPGRMFGMGARGGATEYLNFLRAGGGQAGTESAGLARQHLTRHSARMLERTGGRRIGFGLRGTFAPVVSEAEITAAKAVGGRSRAVAVAAENVRAAASGIDPSVRNAALRRLGEAPAAAPRAPAPRAPAAPAPGAPTTRFQGTFAQREAARARAAANARRLEQAKILARGEERIRQANAALDLADKNRHWAKKFGLKVRELGSRTGKMFTGIVKSPALRGLGRGIAIVGRLASLPVTIAGETVWATGKAIERHYLTKAGALEESIGLGQKTHPDGTVTDIKTGKVLFDPTEARALGVEKDAEGRLTYKDPAAKASFKKDSAKKQLDANGAAIKLALEEALQLRNAGNDAEANKKIKSVPLLLSKRKQIIMNSGITDHKEAARLYDLFHERRDINKMLQKLRETTNFYEFEDQRAIRQAQEAIEQVRAGSGIFSATTVGLDVRSETERRAVAAAKAGTGPEIFGVDQASTTIGIETAPFRGSPLQQFVQVAAALQQQGNGQAEPAVLVNRGGDTFNSTVTSGGGGNPTRVPTSMEEPAWQEEQNSNRDANMM
mgnify:CR=1 FL=1